MLHVFFGNDTLTARRSAQEFVDGQRADQMNVERIDTDSFRPGLLTELAGTVSLFGGSSLYVIDTPSVQQDFFTEVIDNLSALSESPNTFVLIEDALLAPEKKKLQKYAATIEEYKRVSQERFNAFVLADYLLKKDKRQLWVGLQEANRAGLAAEEIIGTLWWQLKSLRLAQSTKSAAEAGMKDYPYNKARQALKNFKPGEVEKLSTELLTLYHDGHAGRKDINLALEKWVLTI
jgi:DNA polymerase III delta subunit